MNELVSNQIYIASVFIVAGIIIGLLFDFCRALRKTFKTKDFVTYIEDTLFWIVSGFFLLFVVSKYTNGIIRLYMFASLLIGLILYFWLISGLFIKISLCIFKCLKRGIAFLFWPLKKFKNYKKRLAKEK